MALKRKSGNETSLEQETSPKRETSLERETSLRQETSSALEEQLEGEAAVGALVAPRTVTLVAHLGLVGPLREQLRLDLPNELQRCQAELDTLH